MREISAETITGAVDLLARCVKSADPARRRQKRPGKGRKHLLPGCQFQVPSADPASVSFAGYRAGISLARISVHANAGSSTSWSTMAGSVPTT